MIEFCFGLVLGSLLACFTITMCNSHYNFIKVKNEDLQQRIDKAYELVKQYDNTFIERSLAIKLREILKGDD